MTASDKHIRLFSIPALVVTIHRIRLTRLEEFIGRYAWVVGIFSVGIFFLRGSVLARCFPGSARRADIVELLDHRLSLLHLLRDPTQYPRVPLGRRLLYRLPAHPFFLSQLRVNAPKGESVHIHFFWPDCFHFSFRLGILGR